MIPRHEFGFKRPGVGMMCLLLFLLAVDVRGVHGEDARLAQFREQATQIQSLQATFVQKKQMKILLRPLISTGRFFFRRPAAIRWEYQSPVNSVLTMYQGEVKRFFKRDGKAVQDSGANLQAMQVVMQNITRWLGGRFDDNSDFKTTLEKNRILLTPSTDMSGMIERIELQLSSQPGVIESITIFEDGENYTKIDFKGLEINQPISDSVFKESL